jgi:hypothetical protein
MRRILLACALVVGFLLPARAAGPNLLDLKTAYTAESVIGSGTNTQSGRLWRTPTALRHELAEGGWPQTVIVRFDRNTAWLLVPQLKTAFETDLAGLSQFSALAEVGDRLNPVAVGTETLAGLRATKYRVAVDDAKAGSFNGFVWRTAQGVVLKIEGEGEHQGRRGTVHLAFHNVQMGPQDPTLFEPSADYRRVAVSESQIATVLNGLSQMQRFRGGGTPSR